MTDKTPRRAALLDTNVWRYVIDAGAGGTLLRLARDGPTAVLVAPAVMFEVLRLQDAPLRAKLVRLMTDRRFVRLMPEAYSEAMEILSEIRRVRPEWLREQPEMAYFERLRRDWSKKVGGFWGRCARSPSEEARRLQQIEDPIMLEGGRWQAEVARQEIRASEWRKNPPMDKTLAGFREPVAGWRGDMVEAWRLDSWAGLTFALERRGNAYRDWIAPFVELDHGLLESPQWLQFWLYDAATNALPRQWMRWAHAFAQRFRRVTSGAPADTQLATYFIDADILITADKAMLDILEECRGFAPCPLPIGVKMSGSSAGVEKILEAIATT